MGVRPGGAGGGRLDFERLRAGGSAGDRGMAEAPGDALPSFLGQVVSVEAKLKSRAFCRVVPAAALGGEREGGAGVLGAATVGAAATAPVLVYLLGSFVPRQGDYLVCRFVDHRWVAETTGGGVPHGGGLLIPQCFCRVPATLRMTSGDPNCNYRMFQSCTIQYGPPPPALATAFGASTNAFLSTQSFHDPITGSDFFYLFTCQYNQFFLSRIFPTSPLGSPFFDEHLYNWIVGGYGNTCDPFLLTIGMPFPGSDATCSVSISAI